MYDKITLYTKQGLKFRQWEMKVVIKEEICKLL